MKPFCQLTRLLLLLLLQHGAFASEQTPLLLTLGYGQYDGKRYDSQPAPSLATTTGTQVILQRDRGKDYRLEASHHSWAWFQVQEVPAASTYIALTPRLRGDQVSLEVVYVDRTGNDSVSYSSTVQGVLGDWITLLGHASSAAQQGGKHYSSATLQERLSVKVERVP